MAFVRYAKLESMLDERLTFIKLQSLLFIMISFLTIGQFSEKKRRGDLAKIGTTCPIELKQILGISGSLRRFKSTAMS